MSSDERGTGKSPPTSQAGTLVNCRPSVPLVALASLPMPVLHAMARVLGFLAPYVMRSRAETARANLAGAFPSLAAAAHRRLVREFSYNFADVILEAVKGYSLSEAALHNRVRIKNPELLQRFADANQSLLLVGSHEANWEWVFLACSLRLPFEVHAVYKPLRHARVDAFVRATRSRFGAALFTRGQFVQQMADPRDGLRAIGLIVDERPSAGDARHWVRFLGKDTAFRTAFEQLARLWKFPVVFSSRRRTARGCYEVTFEILGEPPYDPMPGLLVERYAASLERSIRENPADWLWTQRRWETQRSFY